MVVALAQLPASAVGTLPPAGQSTPAISFSGTLSVPVPDTTSAKQIWVGFWNQNTDPITYVDPQSTDGLQWGGNDDCSAGSCDDQIIIDINGESYHQPFSVTKYASGYMVRLDYTDINAPGPELGDVVTVKMVAGAFTMPGDTTGFEPYLRIDNIQTNSQNGALQGNVEATITAPLPDSPDVPQAPTATAGEEQATVTITPNSSGETVSTYRIFSSPDGQTCDVTPPDTSCVVTGLQGGTSYSFTVAALNAGFPSAASTASNSVTPTSTASSSSSTSSRSSSEADKSVAKPAIHLDVQAQVGERGAGTPVLMEGEGLSPGSAYSLILREPSRVIQPGTANSIGRFSHMVNLPPDQTTGSFSLTLSAVGASGESLVLVQSFTIGPDGTFAQIDSAYPTENGLLARTGPGMSTGFGVLGSALLATLAGLALVVASRRRVHSL